MIRIGIISPSEIALRRFIPALKQLDAFEFAGVAYAEKSEWKGADEVIIKQEKEKAEAFLPYKEAVLYDSYTALIEDESVDAIYLPLPPALHYVWAKKALLAGKHILLEKPATTSAAQTQELITLAQERGLGLHENYMFQFHEQLKVIDEEMAKGTVGDVRLLRLSFGFPRRAPNDFRYNKALGGGALLDCGGYTIRYASYLLGDTAKLLYAHSSYIDDFEVDISGSAALVNDKGLTVQVAFGMDNNYKCEIEVWGSKGVMSTDRIFTAPAGFVPQLTVKKNNDEYTLPLPSDDTFVKSIAYFKDCITDVGMRTANAQRILRQAILLDDFLNKTNDK